MENLILWIVPAAGGLGALLFIGLPLLLNKRKINRLINEVREGLGERARLVSSCVLFLQGKSVPGVFIVAEDALVFLAPTQHDTWVIPYSRIKSKSFSPNLDSGRNLSWLLKTVMRIETPKRTYEFVFSKSLEAKLFVALSS